MIEEIIVGVVVALCLGYLVWKWGFRVYRGSSCGGGCGCASAKGRGLPRPTAKRQERKARPPAPH